VVNYNKLSGETDRQTSTRRLHNAPKYDKWRRDDLYHLAVQKGIKNRANMSNEELVAALRHAQSGAG
jgi:hypothetical protein